MPKEKEVFAIDPALSEELRQAKEQLDVAKKRVEAAEVAVYNAAVDHIPEKGTVHVTGVKIATSLKEDWDDEILAEIEVKWPTVSNLPFPFKKTYKADGKSVTYLRENAKSAYDILAKALTVTPKKPTFTLEDKK